MGEVGIVRKIDKLGRLVMPAEFRRVLNIKLEDPIEIFMEGETIKLRKYEDSCVFCCSKENLTDLMGKKVCKDCLSNIK